MRSSPYNVESEAGRSRYTHLFACISEEDGGYVVQIRLYNHVKPENTAWGEEITDSFETASMLIAGLAAEHSIAQDLIEIEIRMHTARDGTRH
jgi:GH15 family glucan-1,4-alpha-glucosidase